MNTFGIKKGVNLGGWLSQCDYSTERMDHFIEEPDIARIASWGVDHVRLPVDYNIFEEEDGTPKEDGLLRVEKAIGWCRKYGLKLVLDLHKTAGFSFDAGEAETGFFDSEAYQERFYKLWERLAARFGPLHDMVAFELLNEVTEKAFMPAWNRIASTCIGRIRAIAPETWLLVGGYGNNCPMAVPDLDLPEDSRLIYNFHCYDPLPFTHQGAYWVPWLDRNARVSFEESGATEAYFEADFEPAIKAAEAKGVPLYCGEYGVIELADPEDILRWYATIHPVFERYGIARCAWSYKEMDFSLGDPRMDSIRDRLLPLL